MTNTTNELPQWTVLYSTPGGRWVGTGRQFYDDRESAKILYDALIKNGSCPIMRPYHDATDRWHLGAAHLPFLPEIDVMAASAEEEFELYNDLNNAPGNTTNALAKHLFARGYRRTNTIPCDATKANNHGAEDETPLVKSVCDSLGLKVDKEFADDHKEKLDALAKELDRIADAYVSKIFEHERITLCEAVNELESASRSLNIIEIEMRKRIADEILAPTVVK